MVKKTWPYINIASVEGFAKPERHVWSSLVRQLWTGRRLLRRSVHDDNGNGQLYIPACSLNINKCQIKCQQREGIIKGNGNLSSCFLS